MQPPPDEALNSKTKQNVAHPDKHADDPVVANSSCQELSAGMTLNERFVLESKIGQGGMGEVWRGQDTVLDRAVAIKFIRPSDPALRERTLRESSFRDAFIEEARIGAKLSHPAIATVYDFGFYRGDPFIVFEYIGGETLQSLYERRGRLLLEDARSIIGPLAAALDYAHASHIVHRDLKPDNIRATSQGRFKILDLGLAKAFRETTDWSFFAGTPTYCSPEQAAGLPCDGRSDQYALALIAYELITGHRPFQSSDWRELLKMHIGSEIPSPESYVKDLPDSVSAALRRALSKNPNNRFPHCGEFAAALGCQILSDSIEPPRLVAIERAQKRTWFVEQHAVHLGLDQDYLWIAERYCVRKLPLTALVDVDEGSKRHLYLHFRDATRSVKETLTFGNATSRDRWQRLLRDGLQTRRSAAAGQEWLTRKQVALLPQLPAMRLQTLGPVQSLDLTSDDACAAVRLQAAALGADAVAGVQTQRVPLLEYTKTRCSGIAIRAIDGAGRLDIETALLSNELVRLSNWILRFTVLVGVLIFMVSAGAISTGSNFAGAGAWAAVICVAFWPSFVAGLARLLLWPRLIAAAGLTAFAVGITLSLWLVRISGAFHAAVYGTALALSAAAFFWYLCRSCWALLRDYRAVALLHKQLLHAPRRSAEYLIVGSAFVYAVFLPAFQGPFGAWLPAFREAFREAVLVWKPEPTETAAESARRAEVHIRNSALVADAQNRLNSALSDLKQNPPLTSKAEEDLRVAMKQWSELAGQAEPEPLYLSQLAYVYFNLSTVLAMQHRDADALPLLGDASEQLQELERRFPSYPPQNELHSKIQAALSQRSQYKEEVIY